MLNAMASVTLGIQSLDVVGESHYQRAIKKARRAPGQIYAELIPEPSNPYDQNAVRAAIWLGTRQLTVGYLARANARKLQPQILRERQQGNRVVVPAQIFGGTLDQPSLGVWVGERYWIR